MYNDCDDDLPTNDDDKLYGTEWCFAEKCLPLPNTNFTC